MYVGEGGVMDVIAGIALTSHVTMAFLLAPTWNRNLSTSMLASLVARWTAVRPDNGGEGG